MRVNTDTRERNAKHYAIWRVDCEATIWAGGCEAVLYIVTDNSNTPPTAPWPELPQQHGEDCAVFIVHKVSLFAMLNDPKTFVVPLDSHYHDELYDMTTGKVFDSAKVP